MKFSHTDLGQRQRGEIVRVELKGHAANVRLLDDTNFRSYRSGRQHSYTGGLAKRSPVDLAIPRGGHWHVAVDMQGLRGSTRASVQVLPRALPPIKVGQRSPAEPLHQILPRRPFSPTEDAEVWDVFISYASENREEIVRPLAEALRGLGLSVWYDEFELRLGDSLRRKIDTGLARSRFGVVVLSEAFFSKEWPQYELDGLVTLEVGGAQALLPLWHKISKDDVVRYSPSLADKIARNTADLTVAEIAQEIFEVVAPSRTWAPAAAN